MAHKIDSSTAVSVMPTPGAAGTGGWFRDGNPGLGIAGTVVTADWLNAQQAEYLNVLAAAGVTPDKTKQDQLLQSIRNLARIKLTAPLTLYVATTGNNTTGTGTSGAPFLTLQRAWDHLLSSYDCNGQQVTIQVANGTYNTPFTAYAAPVGAFNGAVIIQGNTSNPASCVISVTSATAMHFYMAGVCIVRGFKLMATGTSTTYVSNGNAILATNGSTVLYRNMDFGACGHSHLYSAHASYISVADAVSNGSIPNTISGGAPFHIIAADNAVAVMVGSQYTITGTPNFSTAFAHASFGQLHAYGATFTGSATGQRYNSSNLGMILVNGGGETFLPGSTAGFVSTNSVYA